MDCPICGHSRYSCRCGEDRLREYERDHAFTMDWDSERFVKDRLREKEEQRRFAEKRKQEEEEEEAEERRKSERYRILNLERQREEEEYWEHQSDSRMPEPEIDEEGQ